MVNAPFAPSGEVLVEACVDKHNDPPMWRGARTLRFFENLDANGHRLKMKSVLPPRSGYGSSYLNVYVANGAVIGTCFGDSECDETAAQTLTEAFPGREIVMLRTDNLVGLMRLNSLPYTAHAT